jgi:hypothetical protein
MTAEPLENPGGVRVVRVVRAEIDSNCYGVGSSKEDILFTLTTLTTLTPPGFSKKK